MFNNTRFALARKRRKLTKRELAKKINVTEQAVSGYENGKIIPEQHIIKKIASALYFPVDFFFADDVDEIFANIASFRTGSIKSASQRDAVMSVIVIALLLNQWIEEYFNLPALDFPEDLIICKSGKIKNVIKSKSELDQLCKKQLSNDENEDFIESAVNILRKYWLICWHPIKSIFNVVESKGIRLFSLPPDIQDIGPFSFWYDGKPFIFLDTRKRRNDLRFDVAHELGHLFLHRHGSPQGQEAEKEANAFALAFLMPMSDISQIPHSVLWSREGVISALKRWGVSLNNLFCRLYWVNRMDLYEYESFYRQFDESSLWNRNNAIGYAPCETSQLFKKIFAILHGEEITKNDIARDLCIYPNEINDLISGLTFLALDGSRIKPNPNKSNTNLKVIK